MAGASRMRIHVALAACLLAATQVAAKDEVITWSRDTAGWMVASDITLGGSCFIATVFEDGTFLRVGFQSSDAPFVAYVAIGNADWKSIEPGKEYSLVLQIDREDPWDAPATGSRINGLPTLFINFSDSKFIGEFVRKHGIRFNFNGTEIAHLSLKGSALASKEMVECQRAVADALGKKKPDRPAPKDPFQVGDPSPKRDPFEL